MRGGLLEACSSLRGVEGSTEHCSLVTVAGQGERFCVGGRWAWNRLLCLQILLIYINLLHSIPYQQLQSPQSEVYIGVILMLSLQYLNAYLLCFPFLGSGFGKGISAVWFFHSAMLICSSDNKLRRTLANLLHREAVE